MGVLLTKLLLAPLCVAAASLVSRRWGARAGGLAAGLPVVGGPILLVLALEHGRAFGSEAGAASLTGLLALTVFVLVYGWLALRAGPVACVLAGWAAFLATVALLDPVDLPLGVVLAVVCVAFAAGARWLPQRGEPQETGPSAPAWDLPVRMAAACALVVALSAASASLGAHRSGLLAPFPIIAAVLAGFTHQQAGTRTVEPLLRGFLIGYYGYAAFCFVVALALPGLAIGPAFVLATVAALATQGATVGVTRLAR